MVEEALVAAVAGRLGALRQLMEEGRYPLTVYAVNVGDLADAWEEYRKNLPGAVHLWDPLHESDWQIQYGVLQTPKLFLIGPDGVILGRGLDTPALRLLLEKELDQSSYVYGEAARLERFGQLFSAYGDSLKTGLNAIGNTLKAGDSPNLYFA